MVLCSAALSHACTPHCRTLFSFNYSRVPAVTPHTDITSTGSARLLSLAIARMPDLRRRREMPNRAHQAEIVLPGPRERDSDAVAAGHDVEAAVRQLPLDRHIAHHALRGSMGALLG